MIDLINVSKAYRKNSNVVENINLRINDGEIFGFIGPNGAGKTTTIKMMTGILDIDEGNILIDNKSIKKNPVQAKKRFGFVPDDPNIFLKLTGIEYLNFIADIYEVNEKERLKEIEKITKEFEIYDAFGSSPVNGSSKIQFCGLCNNTPLIIIFCRIPCE